MRLELDRRFQNKVKGRVERYRFEVGVLQDAQYKLPKRGERGKKGRDVIANYAGGPVRKKSRKDSGLSISEVSKENRDRLGVNYLLEPFKKDSSDIMKFVKEFFKLVTGTSQGKRLTNLLQAVVRNPILRGEYGTNSTVTRRIKGFNRPMIDTAQLFKAIKAKVKRV